MNLDDDVHLSYTLPARAREGIVPRERALLSRPGSEEGEALRVLWLCWRMSSCDRLGGGVGMKVEDPDTGADSGGQ